MYTREDYNKEVKIVVVDKDQDSGLELLCYSDCTIEDNDVIKDCRGIVFDGSNIVLKSFSYTPEYNETNFDEVEKILGPDLSLHKFYVSHEGTILRVFYHKNKWFLSTHRKLDAHKSKWSSSESFGDKFFKCLNREPSSFFNSLNKEKRYIYLLRHSEENRVVCRGENKLYPIGIYEKDGSFTLQNEITSLKFSSLNELMNNVKNTNIDRFQGIICFVNNGTQMKIVSKKYQELFELRGNEQSVKFRYLQLRNQPEKVKKFKELYPNACSIFESYESIIDDICCELEGIYFKRYDEGKYVFTSPEKHKLLKKSHDMNMPIRDVISNETAIFINRLIKKER